MNSILKCGIFVSAAALLASCTTEEPQKPPLQVSFKSQAARDAVVRHTDVSVRTYSRYGVGNIEEVTGIPCTLSSVEFDVTFVTPAKIYAPVIKGQPSSVYASCEGEGYKATETFEPSLQGVGFGGPSVAGLVAAAVSTAIVVGRNEYAYPKIMQVHQVLDPKAKPKK